MDSSHLPFMWNTSLRAREDSNGINVGLSHFADTDLRLYSQSVVAVTPQVPRAGGSKRKCDAVDRALSSKNEVSLALELGSSGSSLLSNENYAADKTQLIRASDAGEQTHADICLDFNLNLGSKRPCKVITNSSTAFDTPEITRPKIDLELSLSTGATESDLTNVENGAENPASSSIEQLVDEGSTSSKWKQGPLLPPIDGFQTISSDVQLEDKTYDLHAVSVVSNPASTVDQQAKIDDPATSKQPRRASMKTCQFPGCQKGARGASGHCISHGGGHRCQRTGCQKGAEGKTAFCKAHGGGRRCEHLGCTKSAEGRTNLCIAHGGGRRCTFPGGCTRAARGKSGLCIRHGGGKRCKMENCTKSAEGLSGLCIAHGGGRRCQYPECTKGAQGSTKFCKAHGGGKRCSFPGCTKGAEGSTLLCKGHGGGKRCSFQGGGVCTKSVHGGTLYCVAHGGGKRCGVIGCTKSARGRTNFCVRHGGGKRCKYEGCGKSAQGSTDFCKAHGGGRRCLWGQPGSGFGKDDVSPCDKFARGKTGLCAAHSAQVHDKRVHGNGTVGLNMKEFSTASPLESADNIIHEGSSSLCSGFNFEGTSTQMVFPGDKLLDGAAGESLKSISLPEGRVHGGGLLAMLRWS